MWPDSPFAAPRSSYVNPVPVPSQGPDAFPKLTVQVACSWLPYIRGALKQLLLQTTWDTTDPSVLAIVQQQAFDLIDLFPECNSGPAFSCPYDFTGSGAGPNGWTNTDDTPMSPNTQGVFTSGLGWSNTESVYPPDASNVQGVDITLHFPSAVTIINAEYVFYLVKGTFNSGDWQNGIILYNGGSAVATNLVESESDPDGSAIVRGVTPGTYTVTDIRVVMRCASSTSPLTGGGCAIQQINYDVQGGGCGI